MIGYVDGSVAASTRRFNVVLEDSAVVQLDDLVATCQRLGDGREVVHYGIVVEAFGSIEGALLPSDTRRIGENVMPGLTTRSATVQILRTVPELWLAPLPGSTVELVSGAARDQALFVDQMTQRLAVGLDQHDQPIFADFSFMSGERGGHVSISGVSGVAAKTSYAMFLLYQLLETPQGAALLGPARERSAQSGGSARCGDLRRLSVFDAGAARTGGALSARDDGPRPAARPGADPTAVSVSRVRHEYERTRARSSGAGHFRAALMQNEQRA